MQDRNWVPEISQLFMIPKRLFERLSTRMQIMETNCQTCPQPELWASPRIHAKEPKLKLSLETRQRGEVIVVYCQGRIVYRDEAVALSSMVGDLLENGSKVVLDLSGVTLIDSAGIGELVLLHTSAQAKNAELKYAGPRPFVKDLFDLTHLDSLLEIHPSLGEALAAFQPAEMCADC
jgi:anti-sigma B factor antagonist